MGVKIISSQLIYQTLTNRISPFNELKFNSAVLLLFFPSLLITLIILRLKYHFAFQ
jgi:hypothetical protein